MKNKSLTPPRLALWVIGLLAAGLASPGRGAEVVVGMDKEIFGNPEAAEVVQQARKLDPAYSRNSDLSKAIELYEKAIELQPGAKINAALAGRIAQGFPISDLRFPISEIGNRQSAIGNHGPGLHDLSVAETRRRVSRLRGRAGH